jgi:hypothetical protein
MAIGSALETAQAGRRFEGARAFARGLKLKSHKEWKAYATPILRSAQGAR